MHQFNEDDAAVPMHEQARRRAKSATIATRDPATASGNATNYGSNRHAGQCSATNSGSNRHAGQCSATDYGHTDQFNSLRPQARGNSSNGQISQALQYSTVDELAKIARTVADAKDTGQER